MGLPYICPYNVNSIMNPILVMCLGLGYFFNLYRGKPLVRQGGVLIMSHPTPWEFHPVHHPSYIDFFEQVLAETTDPAEIEAKFEKDFADRPVVPSTSTARATRTTASTRSTCGTGAPTRCSTSAASSSSAATSKAVRRLGFKPASTLRDALRDGERRRRPRPDDHPPAQPADPAWPT